MPSSFGNRIRNLALVMKKPKNILVIMIVLAAAVTVVFFWDWLGSEHESNSETLRNIALILAALLGLPLAFWRIRVANRQAETSERGLRNERFQKSADMLGSKTFTVRTGGIYALERLARDHPEDYLDQVIKLLAAFVRYSVPDGETVEPDPEQETPASFRTDVKHAISIIGNLDSNEAVEHDRPDLRGANLSNMIFLEVSLANMNLANVKFLEANLAYTNLVASNLSGANLTGADITNAEFFGTTISDTDFSGIKGLTQEQLDKACQLPGCPPKNLPPDLTWDEEAAVARWQELYGEES